MFVKFTDVADNKPDAEKLIEQSLENVVVYWRKMLRNLSNYQRLVASQRLF